MNISFQFLLLCEYCPNGIVFEFGAHPSLSFPLISGLSIDVFIRCFSSLFSLLGGGCNKVTYDLPHLFDFGEKNGCQRVEMRSGAERDEHAILSTEVSGRNKHISNQLIKNSFPISKSPSISFFLLAHHGWARHQPVCRPPDAGA